MLNLEPQTDSYLLLRDSLAPTGPKIPLLGPLLRREA